MLIIKLHGQNYSEMENRQKILNLLGLARRAGKVVAGEEMVLKKLRNGQLSLVLMASDCGQATRKKVTDKCQSYQVDLCEEFNQVELSLAIGQKRTIVALTDKGFAQKIQTLLVF